MLKLATGEISTDQILSYTSQQFADQSLQQLRQKQLISVVEDAHRSSTEEQLERKRREVMEGMEAWRHVDGGVRGAIVQTPDIATIDREKAESTNQVKKNQSSPSELTIDISPDEEVRENKLSSPSPRELSSPHSPGIKESSTMVKRPLEVDAVARFTTSNMNPAKMAKRVQVEDENSKNEVDLVARREAQELAKVKTVESPRNSKAPSLLEILKANKEQPKDTRAAQPTSSQVMPNQVTSSSSKSALQKPPKSHLTPTMQVKSGQQFVPCLQLLNKEGHYGFTITRPGGITMSSTMMTNDK